MPLQPRCKINGTWERSQRSTTMLWSTDYIRGTTWGFTMNGMLHEKPRTRNFWHHQIQISNFWRNYQHGFIWPAGETLEHINACRTRSEQYRLGELKKLQSMEFNCMGNVARCIPHQYDDDPHSIHTNRTHIHTNIAVGVCTRMSMSEYRWNHV